MTATQPTSRHLSLGRFGESLAAAHLVRAGMTVLDRNWRCPGLGELDLVLRDGGAVVFCEVKTRSSLLFGDPLEGVTPTKAARVRRLADQWLDLHPMPTAEVRIDLVGVLVDRRGRGRVEHVRAVS